MEWVKKLYEKTCSLKKSNVVYNCVHLTINRESRMIQLKEEINSLLLRLRDGEKYKIVG